MRLLYDGNWREQGRECQHILICDDEDLKRLQGAVARDLTRWATAADMSYSPTMRENAQNETGKALKLSVALHPPHEEPESHGQDH
jgi:hypothetical protein